MSSQREWAKKMIPTLVRWAYGAWDKPHYYSELSASVGYKSNRIGGILGVLQDIINEMKERYGKEIPTLNGLVQLKETGLPNDGFDYVVPNYSKLSPASKRGEVKKLNDEAHRYDWSWILKELNLSLASIDISTSSKQYGYGGEGAEHKSLKEHIKQHPECIGIRGVSFREIEHPLLSGDRLDVYFECTNNTHYAIEIKPSTSDEADIRRGIFQCVKYKAVMDAERVCTIRNYENMSILVMSGEMSSTNKQIATDLGVSFVDNYHIVKNS